MKSFFKSKWCTIVDLPEHWVPTIAISMEESVSMSMSCVISEYPIVM